MSDVDARDREVPDTGQARPTIQRGRWTEERNALAGKLLDHLVDYEAALGRLPVDGVDGAMAVRLANVVLSAGWQPPGDTGQAPDGDQDELGEAARRLDAAAVRVHTGASRVLRWLATDLRDARAAVGADWARPTARALLGTETGRPAGEMPTGQAFLDEFYTPSLLSRDTMPEDRP